MGKRVEGHKGIFLTEGIATVVRAIVGVAAVRSRIVTTLIGLLHNFVRRLVRFLRFLWGRRSGESGADKKESSEDVGELHFGWVDGAKEKKGEFDDC